jgi:amino acid efflux transporter
MSDAFGSYGGTFVAVLAVFVTFGTVNAYVAGMARVYYAAARDGVFPRTLAAVDRETGAPRHSLVFLTAMVLLSLAAFYFLNVDFVSAFLMASGAAILTYVIGSVAGIRLLNERGMRRVLPWISLGVSVILLPFIGTLLAASAAIAGVGLLASWGLSRRKRAVNAGT